MKISAVILTKNEEKNLEQCLSHLQFCDELVVIDDYSSDRTIAIAKKYGAKVIQRHLNFDWASQRNFGIANSQHDWILFVDADEVISERLANEIISIPDITTSKGFVFRRADYFLGKLLKHGESGKVQLTRLGKRKAGLWKRKVHEYWDIDNVKKLSNPIFHYPHRTLSDFILSLNIMAQVHAEENLLEAKGTSVFKSVFWPIGKFVQNYIFRLGFLDGVHGFVFAVMMSFHSFLAWSSNYLKKH